VSAESAIRDDPGPDWHECRERPLPVSGSRSSRGGTSTLSRRGGLVHSAITPASFQPFSCRAPTARQPSARSWKPPRPLVQTGTRAYPPERNQVTGVSVRLTNVELSERDHQPEDGEHPERLALSPRIHAGAHGACGTAFIHQHYGVLEVHSELTLRVLTRGRARETVSSSSPVGLRVRRIWHLCVLGEPFRGASRDLLPGPASRAEGRPRTTCKWAVILLTDHGRSKAGAKNRSRLPGVVG
jgi:hypothetical protein